MVKVRMGISKAWARATFAPIVSGLLSGAAVPGAGCSAAPKPAPEVATQDEPAAPADTLRDTATSDDPLSESAEPEAVQTRASCTNGACFECSGTSCLRGSFCDESLRACGWLPQCAVAPSCDCVLQHLPSCTCEVRDDNVFVSCPN